MPTTLHLWINHLPLDISVLATVLALVGLIINNGRVVHGALYVYIAAAAAAIATYRSGPVLAGALGWNETTGPAELTEHMRLGYLGLTSIVFTGVLSLAASFLFGKRESIGRIFVGFILAFSLVSTFFAARAYISGKQLGHHDELQQLQP